jgi:glycosyltransferase involved in cell wall biosynthesis
VNDEVMGGAPALETSRHPAPGKGAADPSSKLGDVAAEAGLQRIEIVAWRDLDHPEAGGSEIHAARIAERWAAAGIDVTVVASRAPGAERNVTRDGYHVSRPAGRYSVFPIAGASALSRRGARPDGTVEVWNGMPFFSPLWAPHPRVVFLHHVHDGMWDLVLPVPLAKVGKLIERRVAPSLYRGTPVVTLSESSRQGILGLLRLDPAKVSVVQPGVDDRFTPGGQRAGRPMLVAVGRLVPYKRFDLLIEILVRVKGRHPDLQAVIAGEGSERAALERLIADHHAQDWLRLPGRIDDEDLLDLYRRAWALLSTSAYEGWGLTISEAAACGTPAVVSPIAGHIDAVQDGVSGLVAEPGPAMEEAVHTVLRNQIVRRRLERGALKRAQQLTWDRTALQTLQVLAGDAIRP